MSHSEKPTPLDSSLTLSYWTNRWVNNDIGWNETDGNKLMWKYFPDVLKTKLPEKKPEELRVFVPLCGKAKDMYLLYQMGFTVVGIEISKEAIDDFFTENGVEEKEMNQPFRSSKDGRLILGQGDLFTFSGDKSQPIQLPFEKFDVMWDRGSFVALNAKDRTAYASMMMSLMADDGLYLLCSLVYDISEYGGPPLTATTEDLMQFYGERCDIQVLDKDDLFSRQEKWKKRGLSMIDEVLHLITLKNN